MLELLFKNLQGVDMLVVINANKHDIVCFIIGDSVLLFVNQHSAQYNACVAHSWYLVNSCWMKVHDQHIEYLNLLQFSVSFESQLLLCEDKTSLLEAYFPYNKKTDSCSQGAGLK